MRLAPLPRFTLIFAALALAAPLAARPAAPARPAVPKDVEILTGADSMTVEVRLAPLQPLSPAMRALLAFYAMRANGGCPPQEETDRGLRCPLTTALGLGEQCSREQMALVKKWFKDGIPPIGMSREEAAGIDRSGDLGRACSNTPYTATHQTIWTRIRVRREKGGLVTVTSEGSWTAGPAADGGTFSDVATYRLLADRIRLVRHSGEAHSDAPEPTEDGKRDGR